MKKILIVDDEFSIAETCADVLAWEGYEAAVVANGEEALESIRGERPDLVLLDYMMPVLDGLALLEIIRHDELLKALPVVLMTAARLTIPPEKRRWDALLLKPFSADQLMKVVQQFLGGP